MNHFPENINAETNKAKVKDNHSPLLFSPSKLPNIARLSLTMDFLSFLTHHNPDLLDKQFFFFLIKSFLSKESKH